jgi:WD40 repeat protein
VGRSLRTDCFGDVLPPGALARLGTVRLHHTKPVGPLAFCPDGKVLASAGFSIRLWDVATGKELRQLKGSASVLAFSPDGKFLAATEDDHVRVYETGTCRELCRRGGHRYFAEGVAFSPDGKLLASGDRGETVHLWEIPTGKEVRKLHGHGGFVVGFSPDGKSLISSCSDGYCLLDVSTGNVLRRWPGTVYLTAGTPGAALSPDGGLLALGGNDPRIHLHEVATGKQLREFELEQQHVMPPGQCLVFSPDGKLLAGTEQMSNTVHLWEVATGKERSRLHIGRKWVGQVAFSPDSKTLAVAAWNRVRLFETAGGKEILPFGPFSGHEETVFELAFAPDGKMLASHGEEDDWLLLWDPTTGKKLRQLDLEGAGSFAFAPDGRSLATAGKGGVVRVWEPATGKVLRNWREEEQEIQAVTFALGDHLLVHGERGARATLWDLTTGKAGWQQRADLTSAERPRFSSDGSRLLFHAGHGTVRVRETRTGQELDRINTQARKHFLSPDSQFLVGIGEEKQYPDGSSGGSAMGLRFWNLAPGRKPRPFTLDTRNYFCAAFSPDDRVVAAGSGDDRKNEIRLYEMASRKQIVSLRGHQDGISALAFSADGRLLASGSYDQTALVWDVTGLLEDGEPRKFQPMPGELQELWSDLSSPDASRAHRALWKLVAGAQPTVAYLGEHLRPAAAPDTGRIARLIADLDADQFAVREKAAVELEALGESAEPALRKALTNKPSPELRRRIDQILDGSLWPTLPPHQLQALRAVAVLEHVGSPEARKVLETLAHGAPTDQLTRDAQASLERLARRQGERSREP